MSWPFLGSTPVIAIRILNPVLDVDYPRGGEVEAVVDTGYEGFLLVPWRIFQEAHFNELRITRRSLLAADGKRFTSSGALGLIEFPDLRMETEGLIESSPAFQETLIGMQGLEGLLFELDSCAKESRISPC